MKVQDLLSNAKNLIGDIVEVEGVIVQNKAQWYIANELASFDMQNAISLDLSDIYVPPKDKESVISEFLDMLPNYPLSTLTVNQALSALDDLKIRDWRTYHKYSYIPKLLNQEQLKKLTKKELSALDELKSRKNLRTYHKYSYIPKLLNQEQLKKLTEVFFAHGAENWLLELIRELFLQSYSLRDRLSTSVLYRNLGRVGETLPRELLRDPNKFSYPARIVAKIMKNDGLFILQNISSVQIDHSHFSAMVHPIMNIPKDNPIEIPLSEIIDQPQKYLGQKVHITGVIRGQGGTIFGLYPNKAYLEFYHYDRPPYGKSMCLFDEKFANIIWEYFDISSFIDGHFTAEISAIGQISLDICNVALTELEESWIKYKDILYTLRLDKKPLQENFKGYGR